MTKLVAITLDEKTIARKNASVDHERAVAIYDLIEDNTFDTVGDAIGPFKLILSLQDNKLVFDIYTQCDSPVIVHVLSLTPFRKIVKDYFMVCDSYYTAIRSSTPSQIEAIDMGRRGLHNEGSELLKERLCDKLTFDFETSRRLFTLIATLMWKG
jgi:uncharacterized protein (UPF0262 family)